MNCREAQTELYASDSGIPLSERRPDVAAHLAECPGCRAAGERLLGLVAAWQSETRSVRVPDASLEWERVRLAARRPVAARRSHLRWVTLPLGAAAAAALGIYIATPSAPSRPPTRTIARAAPPVPAVVPSSASESTVVYVDDKSGWTFVLSPDAQHI